MAFLEPAVAFTPQVTSEDGAVCVQPYEVAVLLDNPGKLRRVVPEAAVFLKDGRTAPKDVWILSDVRQFGDVRPTRLVTLRIDHERLNAGYREDLGCQHDSPFELARTILKGDDDDAADKRDRALRKDRSHVELLRKIASRLQQAAEGEYERVVRAMLTGELIELVFPISQHGPDDIECSVEPAALVLQLGSRRAK